MKKVVKWLAIISIVVFVIAWGVMGLKILDNENYISSHELAGRLFVSMPTIRRDLAYLEKKKQIVRSHGGARKINDEKKSTLLLYFRDRTYPTNTHPTNKIIIITHFILTS